MTLSDTGAIVSVIDVRQPHCERCRATLQTLPLPIVTTWAAFAESMHLLYRSGGWPLQEALWRHVTDGIIEVWAPANVDLPLINTLMSRYRDRPMDLADACLLALAEKQGFRRIFTLDSDFRIYRLANGDVLESVP